MPPEAARPYARLTAANAGPTLNINAQKEILGRLSANLTLELLQDRPFYVQMGVPSG
jgi:hypothetical protein